MVKNLPVMRETWVGALSQEDPLQKGVVTHSSIPAWEIPWTEEPASYSPWGWRESGMTEPLTLSLYALTALPRWRYQLRVHLPVQEMEEKWVRSLRGEDPLEEEMAPYSSILAWEIPRTEEPVRLQSRGSQRVRCDSV